VTLDLQELSVGDVLRCGLELRRVSKSAPTMEQAAEAVVRYFYESCVDARSGARQCVLVRCYKTHDFGALDPGSRDFVRRRLSNGDAPDTMKCLTLLATAGDEPAWNTRTRSRGHRAIPLPSRAIVEQAPMVAQLIRQLGLEVEEVIAPSAELVRDLASRRYNVFYVENAFGSPYIPAQEDFVRPYGVRSVVGFGGLLRTGELYCVILFCRTYVPMSSADRFRAMALDVRSILMQYRSDRVFAEGA